jgi:hypothetical protein
MATREQLEMLAGRALLDQKFLYELVRDPQAVANSAGIHLDEDQVEKLMRFQEQEAVLNEFATRIGDLRGETGRFDPTVMWAGPPRERFGPRPEEF